MSSPNQYPLNPVWHLMLRDLGIETAHVLRRAGVAADLFAREQPAVDGDEFCRLLWAVEAEAADPALAIRVGQALSFEMFAPPVFAAMCSENLNIALHRLARHKRLCAPIALHVDVGPESTRLGVTWHELGHEPPPLLYTIELACAVRLARLCTRLPVRPLAVTCQFPVEPPHVFAAYLGVPVTLGPAASVEFSAADAAAPFLTANAAMWKFFEPELRRRLAELDAAASAAERTRAALLELLPGGGASVQRVAERLGVSPRTLQRRLQEEGTSFQRVLDRTREDLARHYLRTTGMPGAEISFLLGFEDPNSFVRAFHEWTGTTPEQVRARLRRGESLESDGAVG